MSIGRIRQHFEQSILTKQLALEVLPALVVEAGKCLVSCLQGKGKVLVCGNGGSASDALHFSAELINGFERLRPPLAAIALNADVSILTSIGNDYTFGQVFAKQVQALAEPKDVLVVLTTSGRSPNILEAIEVAQKKGAAVIVLTGKEGGLIRERGLLGPRDIELCVPSHSVPRIQESHTLILHCLCDYIDETLFKEPELFA